MTKIWILNHYAGEMFYQKGGRHHWFAKILKEKGYEPTIFASNTLHKNTKQITIEKGISITKSSDGINYNFIKTSPYNGNGFSRVINMYSFYKNVKKTMKRKIKNGNIPDVIYASSVHPLTLVAGIKIGKKFNIPVISEVRDLWPEAIFAFNKSIEKRLLGKMLVIGERWIYRKTDALIFTKEGDVDYIKENKWHEGKKAIDLDKIYYINNGILLDEYNKSINKDVLNDKDLLTNKFKVVYAGAIRPVNNVEKLVKTAILFKGNKEVEFLIYGEGIQLEELKELANLNNLENIKFKGHIEKKYIPYILSKSSVNILNYSQTNYNWTRGNSSNKLFEYMASGKPIISTVKMGYSPFEKYNIGIEIEDASAEQLYSAILKIKNLPKEEYDFLSNNALIASENYDFNKHTNKLIDIINNLLKEKGE